MSDTLATGALERWVIYAARADKTVMLAADRSLPYARVVEVMDACRAAGIERIGVVTARGPNDASSLDSQVLPP